MCVAAAQVAHAFPALVGDGPSWATLSSMNDEARRIAVGPNGRPTEYPAAWGEVQPGESAAFDVDFEFPGLLWSPEQRYLVHFLPPTALGLDAWLDARNVRLVAVGPDHAARLASAQWKKLFDCTSADCAVYVRRP